VKKDSERKLAESSSTSEMDGERAAPEEIKTSKTSGSTTEKMKNSYESGKQRD